MPGTSKIPGIPGTVIIQGIAGIPDTGKIPGIPDTCRILGIPGIVTVCWLVGHIGEYQEYFCCILFIVFVGGRSCEPSSTP